MRYWVIALTTALLLTSSGPAQTVYEPVHATVYGFLESLDIKGVIDTDDEVKPFTRKKILSLLQQAKDDQRLTARECDELNWYLQEFAFENGSAPDGRWRLASHNDSLFSFSLTPVTGLEGAATAGETGYRYRWGARLWGTYGSWFGAHMSFRDIGQYGDNVDDSKQLTPERGYFINSRNKDGIEFSDVKGSINIDFGWGSVALIKDDMQWGHGSYGQLILSGKPSSYPQIRLELRPADWFRFVFIHGWLTSNVDDSTSFYPLPVERKGVQAQRRMYYSKYIAANMLTVEPFDWLDVSVGNSAVYSEQGVNPAFLLPFNLYKFMDHNAGKSNDYGSNGQLFWDVLVKYPQNVQFYHTFFLDMTEVRNLLERDFWNTWFGFTLGVRTADLLVDNTAAVVEYTRVNPWVYEHYIPTTTYKHIDYTLGHWIGQNADHLKAEIIHRPLRGLRIAVYAERFRKGGLEAANVAYGERESVEFLSGRLRDETAVGLEFSYEYLHDLVISGTYRFSDITDEQTGRTPGYLLGANHSFSLGIRYGY